MGYGFQSADDETEKCSIFLALFVEFFDLHAQSENDGGRPQFIKGAGVSEHVADGGGSDVVEFFGGDSGHFIFPCALLSGRAPG